MHAFRSLTTAVALGALAGYAGAQTAPVETIGPWQIKTAPVSAAQVGGTPLSSFDGLSTQHVGCSVNAAFSGISIIDDGFPNAGAVIEICFASGSVFNVAGPDLVIFGTDNSAWGHGPYLVSTNFDAFANQVVVPASAATFTGESRYYWEPMGSVWVADVWATPLDLSSLGVPANAPVDRVRFNLSSGCLGIGALWYPNVGATYCTAGTTSHGCAAMVTGTGTASASASSGFDIRASNVEGQRMGLIFYGQSTGAWPWAIGSTSFVCVGAPVQRMGTTNSAGTLGACDGELLTDWNAFRSSHPNAVGSPFAAGQVFYAQAWFRDPGAVKGTSLSNALQFFASP